LKIKELFFPNSNTKTGIFSITPVTMKDERGFFAEVFRKDILSEYNICTDFVQENLSYSYKDVLRGLHYQSEPGQAKLISVVKGIILDVVVDIRPESETYKKWLAYQVSSNLKNQIFIPIGFAHGFLTLSQTALVSYKVSSYYNKDTERTIKWDDPSINIDWPIKNPILSERDQKGEFIDELIR